MGIFSSLTSPFLTLRQFNRECRLIFGGTVLNGISQGIFIVVFNLYILSMGISTDALGGILSAGPFAQALGSIPVGFLMESIGYKKTFLLVYGVSGLSKILQVSTPSVPLIASAAFVGGLTFAGDFVVRLPFLAANTRPEQRTQVYSLSSILFSVSMSIGSLLAGYAPSLFQQFGMDATGAYRLLLLLAGLLSVVSILPILLLKPTNPVAQRAKISLAPYLWGIDRFTLQQAAISLFVGLNLGLTFPFMNIYFLYHLGTTREYFGVISALAIIPTMIATAGGPILARWTGMVRAVTILRALIPFMIVNLALTTLTWSGTISYWLMNAMNTASQPLSFAFAMRAARNSAKAASAAWLNVTFWLGVAGAAPIAGAFLGKEEYQSPLLLAAASILIAGILNAVFFTRLEAQVAHRELEERRYEVETG